MLLEVPTIRLLGEQVTVYAVLLGLLFFVLGLSIVLYLWRMRTTDPDKEMAGKGV
jgi:hypothetical protein